jgi:hypothetical protein
VPVNLPPVTGRLPFPDPDQLDESLWLPAPAPVPLIVCHCPLTTLTVVDELPELDRNDDSLTVPDTIQLASEGSVVWLRLYEPLPIELKLELVLLLEEPLPPTKYHVPVESMYVVSFDWKALDVSPP